MVQNFATVIAHENKYVEGTQTSIRIFAFSCTIMGSHGSLRLRTA